MGEIALKYIAFSEILLILYYIFIKWLQKEENTWVLLTLNVADTKNFLLIDKNTSKKGCFLKPKRT